MRSKIPLVPEIFSGAGLKSTAAVRPLAPQWRRPLGFAIHFRASANASDIQLIKRSVKAVPDCRIPI